MSNETPSGRRRALYWWRWYLSAAYNTMYGVLAAASTGSQTQYVSGAVSKRALHPDTDLTPT